MKRKVCRKVCLIMAVMLVLGGIAPCYASAQENSLKNTCVWLTDEDYWFVEDIGGENLTSVKIADFYSNGGWPGTAVNALWNFSFDDRGDNYARITDNGKYVYFLSDISKDLGSGTLYRASLNPTDSDLETEENDILEIDYNVKRMGGISNMESDGGVYCKRDGELCYFDGESSTVIATETQFYQVVNREYVFYSTYTDDGKYSLYGMKLGDEASKYEIVSNTNFGIRFSEWMQPFLGFFIAVDEQHIYYMTMEEQQTTDLYMTGYGAAQKLITQNIALIGGVGTKTIDSLFYTSMDETMNTDVFTGYIDTMGSEHSAMEIDTLLGHLKEDASEEFRPLYCLDLKNKKTTCVCDFYTEGTCFANYDNGVIGCMYMNPEDAYANLKMPVDVILDDERYREDEIESVYEIINEYMINQGQDFEKIIWNYMLIDETGDVSCSVKLTMGEATGIVILNKGQSLAVLDQEEQLYITDIDTEMPPTFVDMEIVAEDVSDMYTIDSDTLCYEANNTLYMYKNHQQIELGKLGEDHIYNFYEDGSILLTDDYIDQKYGGTLYYISDTGNKVKIGDDVTSFLQLQSGDILYLSEQKLIRYTEGKKSRIADNVRMVWSVTAKKFTPIAGAWG